jgi:hypothetical protein
MRSDVVVIASVGSQDPAQMKFSVHTAVQLNDVFVDARKIVYTVERHAGGLYILEMEF